METTAAGMPSISARSTSGSNSHNVTYLSRAFIKYSEYCTAFWHFPWRSYSFQTFEDQSSIANTEDNFGFRKPTLLFPLTPWSRVLIEKLAGRQLVKKFPAFCGTWRFITALTRARHLSLSFVPTEEANNSEVK
jgi:hypothetical protein